MSKEQRARYREIWDELGMDDVHFVQDLEDRFEFWHDPESGFSGVDCPFEEVVGCGYSLEMPLEESDSEDFAVARVGVAAHILSCHFKI